MNGANAPGRVVVIGTVGIDDIETTRASVHGVLGGSATYACLASRCFAPTTLSSVVGHDFPGVHRELLAERDIDLSGLETADGLTFRWGGRYAVDMNVRETTFVRLHVLEDFDPQVPRHAVAGSFVFLGNTDPGIQLRVLDQVEDPRFVLVDSMDFWIEGDRIKWRVCSSAATASFSTTRKSGSSAATPTSRAPYAEFSNSARHTSWSSAANSALRWSASTGGSSHRPTRWTTSWIPPGPATPLPAHSLAAWPPRDQPDESALRRAVIHGSVAASFTVEAFSVERLAALTRHDIDSRYVEFSEFAAF